MIDDKTLENERVTLSDPDHHLRLSPLCNYWSTRTPYILSRPRQTDILMVSSSFCTNTICSVQCRSSILSVCWCFYWPHQPTHYRPLRLRVGRQEEPQLRPGQQPAQGLYLGCLILPILNITHSDWCLVAGLAVYDGEWNGWVTPDGRDRH